MLDYILNTAKWTPYGIECADEQTAKKVHTFLREAVYDRHIFLSKVIGFAISGNSGPKMYSGTYIARHVNMGESYPEITAIYDDKVFLTQQSNLSLFLRVGANKISEVAKTANPSFEVLYVNDYAGRALSTEVRLSLKLIYGCGYRTMSTNSKGLPDEYFPCNTDFSLQPFVRVLPYPPGTMSNVVPIRYYNHLTMEQFKSILRSWLIHYKSGNLNDEELTWLQSFNR